MRTFWQLFEGVVAKTREGFAFLLWDEGLMQMFMVFEQADSVVGRNVHR